MPLHTPVLKKYLDGDVEGYGNLTVSEARENEREGEEAAEEVTKECWEDEEPGELLVRCVGMVFEDEIAVEMGVVIITDAKLFHYDLSGNQVLCTDLPSRHDKDEPFVDFYIFHDIGFISLKSDSMCQPLYFLPHMLSLSLDTPCALAPIAKLCNDIKLVLEASERVQFLYFTMESSKTEVSEWETLFNAKELHELVVAKVQERFVSEIYEDDEEELEGVPPSPSVSPADQEDYAIDEGDPPPPKPPFPILSRPPLPKPCSTGTIQIGRKSVHKERWARRLSDVEDATERNLRWKAAAQWVHVEGGYTDCTITLTQLDIIIFDTEQQEVWKERITEITSLAADHSNDLIKMVMRDSVEYVLLLSIRGGLAKEFGDRVQKTRPMRVLQLMMPKDIPHLKQLVEEVNRTVASERERTVRFRETTEVRTEDEMSPVTYEALNARNASFTSEGGSAVSDGEDNTPSPTDTPTTFGGIPEDGYSFSTDVSPLASSSVGMHRSKGLFCVDSSDMSFGEMHPLKASKSHNLPSLIKPNAAVLPSPMPNDPVGAILQKEVSEGFKVPDVDTELQTALRDMKRVGEVTPGVAKVYNSADEVMLKNLDDEIGTMLAAGTVREASPVNHRTAVVEMQTQTQHRETKDATSTCLISEITKTELTETIERGKIETEQLEAVVGLLTVPSTRGAPIPPICETRDTQTTPTPTTTKDVQATADTVSVGVDVAFAPQEEPMSLVSPLSPTVPPLMPSTVVDTYATRAVDAYLGNAFSAVDDYMHGLRDLLGSASLALAKDGASVGIPPPPAVYSQADASSTTSYVRDASVVSNDSISEMGRLRELVSRRERLEEEVLQEKVKSRSASPVGHNPLPTLVKNPSDKKEQMEKTLRDARQRRREIENRLVENNIHIDLPARGFAKGFEGSVPLHSSP